MDPASLSLVFQGGNLALRLVALTGVMDTVGMKIDKLLQTDLSAGFRALDQAQQAKREQAHLLREARVNLNRAIPIERGHRKAAALFGLAACHHALGEEKLHLDALKEILAIEPVGKADMAKALGRNLASIPVEAAKKAIQSPGQAVLSVGKAAAAGTRTVGNLLSENGRETFVRKLAVDAVNMNEDIKALVALQEAVSAHLDKPIPWVLEVAAAITQWAKQLGRA